MELVANLRDGGRGGTLLGVLDRTVTAMGGRMLRRWLEQPLLDLEKSRPGWMQWRNWQRRPPAG